MDALQRICNDYFAKHVALHPFDAPALGVRGFDHEFGETELTDEIRSQERALLEHALSAVDQLAVAAQDDLVASASRGYRSDLEASGERCVRRTFAWLLRDRLRRLDTPQHLIPMDHMNGRHIDFFRYGGGADSGSPQPFVTEQDYTNWLQKCKGLPKWVSTATDRMREGIAKGITLPKVLAVRLVEQVNPLHFLSPQGRSHPR
eukprot:TRINITY_DN9683_c0_g1_i2.p1 TRINITY_DN9683_c0_g1~~TRINITY_DN9683_c0_g1_i2.p1  ORF type:complete len:204 (+),score=29.47 TRINITY_DN9683_c0_g1_i2:79-690(+)